MIDTELAKVILISKEILITTEWKKLTLFYKKSDDEVLVDGVNIR